MNVDALDPRRLRYFLAVAEHGSFTAAAAQLHMTQPSLSAAIRMIEDTLGVALFTRTTRSVELTRAGRMLETHAKRILNDLEQAAESTMRAAEGRDGKIVVGFGGLQLIDFMPTILAKLRTELPDLSVEVRRLKSNSVDYGELLRNRLIDVSHLADESDSGSGISLERVGFYRPAVLVPKSHRLAGRVSVALEELAGELFIVQSGDLSVGSAAHTIEVCGASGFVPKLLQAADDLVAQYCLAAAGFGVSLANVPFGELHIPQAVWIPLERPAVQRPVFVAFRDEADPAVASYLAVVREVVSEATRLQGINLGVLGSE